MRKKNIKMNDLTTNPELYGLIEHYHFLMDYGVKNRELHMKYLQALVMIRGMDGIEHNIIEAIVYTEVERMNYNAEMDKEFRGLFSQKLNKNCDLYSMVIDIHTNLILKDMGQYDIHEDRVVINNLSAGKANEIRNFCAENVPYKKWNEFKEFFLKNYNAKSEFFLSEIQSCYVAFMCPKWADHKEYFSLVTDLRINKKMNLIGSCKMAVKILKYKRNEKIGIKIAVVGIFIYLVFMAFQIL